MQGKSSKHRITNAYNSGYQTNESKHQAPKEAPWPHSPTTTKQLAIGNDIDDEILAIDEKIASFNCEFPIERTPAPPRMQTTRIALGRSPFRGSRHYIFPLNAESNGPASDTSRHIGKAR